MTPEELQEIAATEKKAQARHPHHICVCTAAGCLSAGSGEVKRALEKEVIESGRKQECHVKGVGCMGLCSAGPLVTVDETMYQNVSPDDATDIVRSLEDGMKVKRLECDTTAPFFTRQTKIVLENSGRIDP